MCKNMLNEKFDIRHVKKVYVNYKSYKSKKATEKCPFFDWFFNFNSETKYRKKKYTEYYYWSRSADKKKILRIKILQIFVAKWKKL